MFFLIGNLLGNLRVSFGGKGGNFWGEKLSNILNLFLEWIILNLITGKERGGELYIIYKIEKTISIKKLFPKSSINYHTVNQPSTHKSQHFSHHEIQKLFNTEKFFPDNFQKARKVFYKIIFFFACLRCIKNYFPDIISTLFNVMKKDTR